MAGPVDVTVWRRKIQPKHAPWTQVGVARAGEWQQRLSPACGGETRRVCVMDPAAVRVGVVNGELQRARIAGPGDVDMKTDAHDRERLGQAPVKDQDAVWAAAEAAPGDHVPGRHVRVLTVDSGTADVSQRDNVVVGRWRRFGGWRDGAWVVRRKR